MGLHAFKGLFFWPRQPTERRHQFLCPLLFRRPRHCRSAEHKRIRRVERTRPKRIQDGDELSLVQPSPGLSYEVSIADAVPWLGDASGPEQSSSGSQVAIVAMPSRTSQAMAHSMPTMPASTAMPPTSTNPTKRNMAPPMGAATKSCDSALFWPT